MSSVSIWVSILLMMLNVISVWELSVWKPWVIFNVTALHNWSQYKLLVLSRTPPGKSLMTDLPSDLSSPLWNKFILNRSNLFYGLFKLSPHLRRIIPLWVEAEGGSSMSWLIKSEVMSLTLNIRWTLGKSRAGKSFSAGNLTDFFSSYVSIGQKKICLMETHSCCFFAKQGSNYRTWVEGNNLFILR